MSMYHKRLQQLIAQYQSQGIHGVLLTRKENYTYFSGFTGTSAYLLITEQERILFTDSRYMEQAAVQSPDFLILDFKNQLFQTLKQACQRLHIEKLGLENKHLSYEAYLRYRHEKVAPEIMALGDIPDSLRVIKDAEEIAVIREAVKLADDAFRAVLQYIKPGVTEIEIAAEIEYYLKRNGAKGPSFETIVASGKRSSLPHGVASQKKIEQGDPVILDFGAIVKDYCSDMTRTVFVGNPEPEMKNIYETVLIAQKTAVAELRQGMKGIEADRIARKIIEAKGYGECFGHGLGHGVGLEIHEAPTLSPRADNVLQNGMVVTVEPGIYVPDFGGVRIEDMAVIWDNTPEILTASNKEMIVL